MSKLVAFMILSVLVFAWPEPAPVVETGYPGQLDPNKVMLSEKLVIGNVWSKTLLITEPDGDDITVVANGITLLSPEVATDVNDPNGVALQYSYPYQYQSSTTGWDVITVTVTDSNGLSDERIMLFYNYVNKPPVITGCK